MYLARVDGMQWASLTYCTEDASVRDAALSCPPAVEETDRWTRCGDDQQGPVLRILGR